MDTSTPKLLITIIIFFVGLAVYIFKYVKNSKLIVTLILI